MILEGTQPIFTQVPPMIGLRSIIVTLAPFSTAFRAQAKAPEPLPMIATCSGLPLLAAVVFLSAPGVLSPIYLN
jgi:hypothetical protein